MYRLIIPLLLVFILLPAVAFAGPLFDPQESRDECHPAAPAVIHVPLAQPANEDDYFKAILYSAHLDMTKSVLDAYMNALKKDLTPQQISSAEKRAATCYLDGAKKEKGVGFSQHMIGLDYALGNGVQQNWGDAYFWRNVAALLAERAEAGSCFPADASDNARDHLTAEQRNAVDQKVIKWMQERFPGWKPIAVPAPCK